MNEWCVIVMRNIRCQDFHTGEIRDIGDVVTVYGPFTQAEANARAEQFSDAHCTTEDEEPFYRPVADAPAFLGQEHWPEHWAIVRPMNDVPW